MDNKSLIFVGIFFTLCLSVCAGVWYGLHELSYYREEYDIMISERDNFSNVMEGLQAKNKTLKSVNRLRFANVKMASDPIEFYSHVKQAIAFNHVDDPETQMNETSNVITLKLKGNYYALVKMFADWGEMPFATRITSLKIARDKEHPESLVEADVIIEAWMAK